MTLDLASLSKAVQGSAAIRFTARLQPAGGSGDKVFPPTYEGGKYAEETRIIDGQRLDCVHLDSVQSQANRMELALLEACRTEVKDGNETRKLITLPLVEVQFDDPEVGTISSLEAPHRLADAILRDSMNGDKRFRDTDEGKTLNDASLQNVTGLFGISPTSLLFGLWDSTGPKGGLGAKFQRCLVSELVGVNAVTGVKSASRIDPLQIQKNAGPIFRTAEGDMTLSAHDALKVGGKPVLFAKKKSEGEEKDVVYDGKGLPDEGAPSKANHGNVTPSLKNEKGQAHHGGVTFAYAQQKTVLSLPALRRLKFPLTSASRSTAAVDLAAQTVLAALGLCAAALSIAKGCDLRSRCLLVPETAGQWEIIGADGKVVGFSLSADEACKLLNDAVTAAEKVKLPWRKEPLVLKPSKGLAELVKKSRDLAMKTSAEG